MNNSIAEESQNDVTPMLARSKTMEKRRRTKRCQIINTSTLII